MALKTQTADSLVGAALAVSVSVGGLAWMDIAIGTAELVAALVAIIAGFFGAWLAHERIREIRRNRKDD